MPNILTYDAPLDRVTPTDRAADTAREAGAVENRFGREAGEAIGRGVSAFGRPIQEMVNEAENHDVTQLLAHGSSVSSQLNANLTQNAADTFSKGDVTDSSIAPGLREQANKSIDNFLEQYTGENVPKKVQDWALSTADQMRSHQGNLITSFEMERSAGAIKANLQTRLVADANTVDLDPASLPGVLAKRALDNKTLLDSLHVLPEQRNALEETAKKGDSVLAYTAAQSIGKNNPDGLRKQLADGTYSKWLTPEQTNELKKYADYQEEAAHRKKEWDYTEAKRAQTEASETSKNDYVTKMLSGQRPGDFANDPKLTAEAKENLHTFQHSLFEQARDKSENTPHPQEWRDLIDKLHETAEKDPNALSDKPIYDALRANKLNKAEFASALEIFNSKDKPLERLIATQMRRVETFASTSQEGKSDKEFNTGSWVTALNNFELKGRQEIKNAATPEDRKRLSDPLSKDFVFSYDRFRAEFQPSATPSDALKAGADQVRGKGPEVSGRIVKTRDQVQAGEQYTAPDGSIRTKR